MFLHYHAFTPAIDLLGSEEQRKKWVPLALDLKILGSYAQTEIGHGSDVQALELIAEYDATCKQFVFSSPTVTSTIFYPGTLGKTATHALVAARLVSKGADHGV